MELKKVLAGWNKVCPGCNIARKYPDSLIGKKVRSHWERGCVAHNAYVEVYGADEPSPRKKTAKKGAPAKKKPAAPKKANSSKPKKNNPSGKNPHRQGKRKR